MANATFHYLSRIIKHKTFQNMSRYDGIWVRKGQSPYGNIIYTVDGKWIRKGQSPYGDIAYTIDGNWIRKGQDPFGEIVFTISRR